MEEYKINIRLSDNPLTDEEAKQTIKDLQPLIVDIVVTGIMNSQKNEQGEKAV